jgi:hypothetical protein
MARRLESTYVRLIAAAFAVGLGLDDRRRRNDGFLFGRALERSLTRLLLGLTFCVLRRGRSRRIEDARRGDGGALLRGMRELSV